MAERRRRIDAIGITEFLGVLDTLDIRVDESTAARGLKEILALARGQSLSSHDAAYLELAMREGLTLATRDDALAKAARRVGVDVVKA